MLYRAVQVKNQRRLKPKTHARNGESLGLTGRVSIQHKWGDIWGTAIYSMKTPYKRIDWADTSVMTIPLCGTWSLTKHKTHPNNTIPVIERNIRKTLVLRFLSMVSRPLVGVFGRVYSFTPHKPTATPGVFLITNHYSTHNPHPFTTLKARLAPLDGASIIAT